MSAQRLVLPRGTELSEDVAGFVEDFARQAELPSSQLYWLRLAVDEITTNIAEYGYRGGEGVIDLEAGRAPDKVWIRICDDSPPFDPRSYDPTERFEVDPGEREPGGYGLLLALARLDGFDYLREGSRNCAVLTMNRSEPGSQ